MLIEIQEKEQVQQMIINGVAQNSTLKYCLLVCPSCKAILNQVNTSRVNLIKELSVEQNQTIKYCPNCSSKIDYPIIIDAKVN